MEQRRLSTTIRATGNIHSYGVEIAGIAKYLLAKQLV